MPQRKYPKTKILFTDFDDTLVEYHGLGRQVLRGVLKEKNIPFDEKRYAQLPRDNIQDKLKAFMPEHFDEVWPEVDKRFSAVVVQESYLFPETKKFLEKIHKKEILVIIVSTKFARHIHNILKHHEIDKYVTEVIGRETIEPPKPNPKGVLKLLEKYHAKTDETLFLGDSALDGKTASNAKIRFVQIKRKEPTEKIPKPWKTITNLNELINLL